MSYDLLASPPAARRASSWSSRSLTTGTVDRSVAMSAFSDAIVASKTDKGWNAMPKFLRVSSRAFRASARISLNNASTKVLKHRKAPE